MTASTPLHRTARTIALLIAAATAVLAPLASVAQGATHNLRVVTRIIPPFVVKKDSGYTGFSVELWEAIADRMHMKSTYIEHGTVGEILSTVKSGRADVGVAAISVTSQREAEFDFSQPFFNAGLQILVRDKSSGGPTVWQSVKDFFSPDVMKLIGVVLIIVLIPAHLVWLVERHREHEGLVETRKYFPGIFKTLWWSTSTLATQADEMPKTYVGRIIAAIWMFTSVVFVAYFTAQITTSLTVKELQSSIKGPSDLPGKVVATVGGSTSEAYLKDEHATIKAYSNIDDAFAALTKGDVDAIVYDAPILLYYSSHEGKGKVATVGSVFKSEGYGILFPSGSALRKPVNEALLTLREDGTYDKLYAKWFGEPDK